MLQLIRRYCLVLLATAAIGTAFLGAIGYVTPLLAGTSLARHNWVGLHFYDGRLRIFWFESPEAPITVEQVQMRAHLRVLPQEPGWAPPPDLMVGPFRLDADTRWDRFWEAIVRVGDRRSVSDFGWYRRWGVSGRGFVPPGPIPPPVYVTLLRMPIWLPVAVFIIAPLVSAATHIRQRRLAASRRRREACLNCGYDLRGLPAPRCPECGAVNDYLRSG